MWPTFLLKGMPIVEVHLIGLTVLATFAGSFADQLPNDTYRTLVYGDSTRNSLQLQCGVSNVQVGQSVFWYKNNQKISEGSELLVDGKADKVIDYNRYSIDRDYNLIIDPFYWYTAHRDGASYICRVYNSSNHEIFKSDIITVLIYVIPNNEYPVCADDGDVSHNRSTTDKYFEGDHVTLRCISQPGTPPISLLWLGTNSSIPLSIVTQSSNDLTKPPVSNRLILDLEVKDNGTSFSCELRQPGQQNRFCTFGPVTVYNQPNIRIDPEEIVVNSPDQVVKFTCTETARLNITSYRWYIEHTSNFGIVLHVNYLDMNRTIEVTSFGTIKGNIYSIVCEVDYGFSSRNATARLFAGGYSNPPSTVTDQGRVSTNEGIASLRTTAWDSQTESDSSKSIIAPAVGGACALIVICAIVATTACVIKLKRSKQTTESPGVDLNEYSEVNINSQKQETDPTLYSRENIAYEGCSDQTSYSRVNAAYESFHVTISKRSRPRTSTRQSEGKLAKCQFCKKIENK